MQALGLDQERWRSLRRAIRAGTSPEVAAAAQMAAAHLRAMHGRLPLQAVVEECAEYHHADVGAVLSYLCSLGIGFLIAAPGDADAA